MYTTLQVFGKCVIQANPSEFDERLFSDTYFCRLRLRERQTDRQTDRETDRNRQTDRQRRRRRKDVVNQCPSLIWRMWR